MMCADVVGNTASSAALPKAVAEGDWAEPIVGAVEGGEGGYGLPEDAEGTELECCVLDAGVMGTNAVG
jgi:hypothetical protein